MKHRDGSHVLVLDLFDHPLEDVVDLDLGEDAHLEVLVAA